MAPAPVAPLGPLFPASAEPVRRLRIDLLGPLRVTDGDRPLEVRGSARRAVLGVLAANANQAVAEDQLVERLWGDEDPVHSRSIVRAALADLRRLFNEQPGARAGDIVLLAAEPTYQLSAPTTAVDVLRSRDLAGRGRRALREDRLREATELLGAAMQLWRGPALDDVVPAGRSWPEQAELREEHLLLLEDRVTADLAVGRAAELVDELAELVAREPLRERLHALRMRALARVGRADEALRAYDEAATVLAEGWGIDPGHQLRAEREAVLARLPPTSALVNVPIGSDGSTMMFRLSGLSGLVGDTTDPERLAGLLDEIGRRADEPVSRLGGRLIPLQGPAVSAVFYHDDHSGRAVQAALAVRRVIGAVLARFPGNGVQVRGAVASGAVQVSAGAAGAAGLVLAGRTFESCHRMLHAAAPGQILVDETAYRATAGGFAFGAVRVPAGAYEVGGLLSAAEQCWPLPRRPA